VAYFKTLPGINLNEENLVRIVGDPDEIRTLKFLERG
jgi:hypothetical protein